MEQNKEVLAAKGILWGITNRIVLTAVPFLVRTIMIYTIGAEYVGLNSVFTSVLQVLSFAELGLGNVIVYSMYKPISERDHGQICALLSLYRSLYRVIGLIVLVVGLCILPFLKFFVHGAYPNSVNLYILYIVYLLNSVISYWLFIYKDALLSAHQRYYVTSNVNTITSLTMYFGQIIALFYLKNYYAYVIMIPLCTVLNNIGIAITVNNRFPQYKPRGKLDKRTINEIKRNVFAGIGHKLGPTATTSIDNLVVSSSMGLIIAAAYSNYNYIITMISAFISIVFNSFVAGIGNSIIIETREKNYKDFQKYNFFNNWLTGWCAICLVCLSQHFMFLWVGEKKGMEYMFSAGSVLILSIMFYVQQIRTVVLMYKTAAGMWYADKYKPYVATIMNLLLDILLVNRMGIAGVLLSTIMARAVIGIPWETSVMFKKFFKMKPREYYYSLLKYVLITCANGLLTYYICSFLPMQGFDWMIAKMGICLLVPNLCYWVIYRNNSCFKEIVMMIKSHQVKCET